MVEVGDKVLVTPLYGQKDNLAIVASSAAITEGNYNTWTFQWQRVLPGYNNGRYVSPWTFSSFIDEKNDTIVSYFSDYDLVSRFGVHSLSDGSSIFESPELQDYLCQCPLFSGKKSWFNEGQVMVYDTGGYPRVGCMSRSIKSYVLLLRSDWNTLEVWRSGTTALWSRDFRDDREPPLTQDYTYLKQFGISSMGKYVLLIVYDYWFSPPDFYWMLYKGSFV